MIATSQPEAQPLEPKRQYAALIDEFGKGWEKGKSDRMAGVFTDDAVFRPDPFANPLRGRTMVQRRIPLPVSAETKWRVDGRPRGPLLRDGGGENL